MAEKSIEEKAKELEVGLQPTTALGVQSVGGTPMQQAMGGTQAVKDKVAKEQTLAGTERLATPTASTATTAAVATAAERAEKLKTAGGAFGARVEQAIEKQINKAGEQAIQPAPQVNETALGTALGLSGPQLAAAKADPTSTYSKASNIVLAFAASPTPQVRAQALKDLEALGIPPTSAMSLIDTTASTVGANVSAGAGSALTVGSIDLSGLAEGINTLDDLANLLGIPADQLATTNVSDIPQLIKDVQQNELSRVSSLRAQIAGLPAGSQQRSILLKELQALEGAGLGTIERSAAATAEELDTSGKIQIGDQTYTAETLLADGGLSDIITEWMAASPEQRAALLPPEVFPDLVDWLGKNEQALGQLVTDREAEAAAFTESTQAIANSGISDADLSLLIPGYSAGIPLTADQQAALNNSGVGQLLAEGDTVTLQRVNALPDDQRRKALSMSADDLVLAKETADLLESDPELAKLAGVKIANGMVLDEASREKILDYKEGLDAVNSVDSTWANEWFFSDLKPAQMIALSENPERFASLKNFYESKSQVEGILKLNPKQASSIDSILDAAVGVDINLNDLKQQYKDATKWARFGDPTAVQRKKELESAFGFPNLDVTKIQAAMRDQFKGLTPDQIIAGTQTPDIKVDILSKIKDIAQLGKFDPEPGGLFSQFRDILNDGKITRAEMASVETPELQADLRRMLQSMPDGDSLVKAYDDVKVQQTRIKENKEVDTVLKANNVGGSVDKYIEDQVRSDSLANLVTLVTTLKELSTNSSSESVRNRITDILTRVQKAIDAANKPAEVSVPTGVTAPGGANIPGMSRTANQPVVQRPSTSSTSGGFGSDAFTTSKRN